MTGLSWVTTLVGLLVSSLGYAQVPLTPCTIARATIYGVGKNCVTGTDCVRSYNSAYGPDRSPLGTCGYGKVYNDMPSWWQSGFITAPDQEVRLC